MKLVAGGKQRAGEPGDTEQEDQTGLKTSSTAQRPPEQCRQNCVFREVAQFSNEHLHHHNHGDWHVRIEPVQEWKEKARRVLSRQNVG